MSRLGTTYDRLRPLIIWLGLGELAWIGSWLLNVDDSPPAYVATAAAWIVAMLAWMALVSYFGTRGVFLKHTRWLSNLVGFFLVLAVTTVLFGTIDVTWEGLLVAASHTSNLQLVSFHVLRLLAVGTVIKYMQGELPLHFVIFGAVPDLLFAASAVVVTTLEATAPVSHDLLIVWHFVGFFVFFGAGISMFFSVPSPFRIYHDKPDASIVFQFPMLLAPKRHRRTGRCRTRLCPGEALSDVGPPT